MLFGLHACKDFITAESDICPELFVCFLCFCQRHSFGVIYAYHEYICTNEYRTTSNVQVNSDKS